MVEKIGDFYVDDTTKEKLLIPMIPVPENPRYILLSGYKSYSGETTISGFLSSDILNVIKGREGFIRGDLRRFTGEGYAFTTFRTTLCPYNIMQLLKYFGYGLIGVCRPAVSPSHGNWKTVWTLESGKKVPLTKTYVALVKLILDEGWEIGKDLRTIGRKRFPETILKVATGEYHLRVVNYMLMNYFKRGDIYEENYENVRDFLDNLREKTNSNFFNLTDIWATSEKRDAFVQKVMKPITSRIPEQCILPDMGVRRNVLMKLPVEWFGFLPDGKPPPARMSMTEEQRKRYAKLYVKRVKTYVELPRLIEDSSFSSILEDGGSIEDEDIEAEIEKDKGKKTEDYIEEEYSQSIKKYHS